MDDQATYTDIFTGESLTAEQLIERYNPGRLSSPFCGVEEWARLNMVDRDD